LQFKDFLCFEKIQDSFQNAENAMWTPFGCPGIVKGSGDASGTPEPETGGGSVWSQPKYDFKGVDTLPADRSCERASRRRPTQGHNRCSRPIPDDVCSQEPIFQCDKVATQPQGSIWYHNLDTNGKEPFA